MAISKDLSEFVESLNSSGVEYLIVGGFAVAWHGYPRFTADIDFLVRPTRDNANSVLAALAAFGFGSLGLSPEDLCRPDQILQLGAKPNRIAILTSISGVNFDEAWARRVNGELDGLKVQFIGFEDLILNKETTARPKDLGDVDELRKRSR